MNFNFSKANTSAGVDDDIILEVKPTVGIHVVGQEHQSAMVQLVLQANDDHGQLLELNIPEPQAIHVYLHQSADIPTPTKIGEDRYGMPLFVRVSVDGGGLIRSIQPVYTVSMTNGVPDAADNDIVDEIYLGWEKALFAQGFNRVAHGDYVCQLDQVLAKSLDVQEFQEIGVQKCQDNTPAIYPQPIIPIASKLSQVEIGGGANNAGCATFHRNQHNQQAYQPLPKMNFWDGLTMPKAIVIASVMFFLGTGLYAFAGNDSSQSANSTKTAADAPQSTSSSQRLSSSAGGMQLGDRTNTTAFGDAHADQVAQVLKQMGVDASQSHDLGCLVE